MAPNTMVVITLSLFICGSLSQSAPVDTDDIELIQKRIEVESSSVERDQESEETSSKARRRAQLLADRSYYSSLVDMSQTRHLVGMPLFNAHDMPGGLHPSELQLAEAASMMLTFLDATAMTDFCTAIAADPTCSCVAQDSAIFEAELDCSEAAFETFLRGYEEAGGELPEFAEPNVIQEPVDDGLAGVTALLEDIENGPANGIWGIDRIDGETTTDNTYGAYPGSNEGATAHVYVADTGLYWQHSDFEGRAIPAIEVLGGSSQVTECSATATDCANDGHGHGTHCAGTIGGKTYGVAKKVNLYGVKVLNPSGYMSDIIKSVDWVIKNGKKPAVWSASLGGPGARPSYENAFKLAKAAGVVISVAAGNSNDDACKYSPAFAATAITVGSTTSADKRSHFSNYGKCLDIWAPGSSIKSCGKSSTTSSATMSGTSMACPHVSGVLALFLSDLTEKGLTDPVARQNEAETMLTAIAKTGEISDIKTDSPDLFLYTGGKTNPMGGTYTTTTFTTTTTTSTTVWCQDILVNGTTKWHDSYGPIYDCNWYKSGSSNCKNYGHGWKNMGYVANDACCCCGGGITTKPGTTVAPPPGTTVAPPPGTTVAPPPGTTVAPPPGTTVAPPPGTTVAPPPNLSDVVDDAMKAIKIVKTSVEKVADELEELSK